MFHLTLIPDDEEKFKVSVTRIASGFKNPIDAAIVDNKIYVMEYSGGWINNGDVGIYELLFPSSSTYSDSESAPPSSIVLYQNYPNPFNSTTKIQYELHYPATEVNLSIYNSIGNKISELVNGLQGPGSYSVSYDAHDYSSGIYYYRLETSYSTLTKRMIFIK